MATYRSLSTDFWTKRYTQSLTGKQRLVYLYLKLNKHLTVAGCCKLPLLVMESELGYPADDIQTQMQKLIDDGKIAYQDDWLAIAGGNDGQSRSKKLQLAIDFVLQSAPDWVATFLVGGSGPNADPRATHPAVVAVRELADRFPPKELWQELIEVLGDEPDKERLYECWNEWAKRKYRADNYRGWAIDWYINGAPTLIRNGKPGSFTQTIERYQEALVRLQSNDITQTESSDWADGDDQSYSESADISG